jgi:acyl-CoA synthetase (AMP-forming)/AMP-acid ligase II
MVACRHAKIEAVERGSTCCAGRTAYKVPKQVSIFDALPRSAVGKILRCDLRA